MKDISWLKSYLFVINSKSIMLLRIKLKHMGKSIRTSKLHWPFNQSLNRVTSYSQIMGAKWLSIQESKVKQLQNKTTDRILILNSWIIQAMRNKNVSQFQEKYKSHGTTIKWTLLKWHVTLLCQGDCR